jgi:hypothetical protein
MQLEKVDNEQDLLYNLECVNWLDEEGIGVLPLLKAK